MCFLLLLVTLRIGCLPEICGKLCDKMHIIPGGKIMRTAFRATGCVATAEACLALSISCSVIFCLSTVLVYACDQQQQVTALPKHDLFIG